ncbi:apc-17, partial [Pristionchus pacificus]|uniref:Anaphase-promoting complex subunit 1 n=1 Tax=Pristionchus pacificus TaxID=54126 RepID=A0A2A6B8P5_PRIPA
MRNDDQPTATDDQQEAAMIRAEWTRPMAKGCLPPGNQTLVCTRKVSDLVTECLWRVDTKQANVQVYVTLEPEGMAIKSYRTEFDIKQAFWHTFPASATAGLSNGDAGDTLECVCLVGEDTIDMYATIDDHHYTCSVPFKITGVHQSSQGLLLERAQRDKKLFTPPPDFFMPRLFSLSHPYDEALPVLCSQRGQSRLVYCWEGDTEVEVVGTDRDLVLVFDPTAKTHRLYAIRTKEFGEEKSAGGGGAVGGGSMQQLATPRINPEHGPIIARIVLAVIVFNVHDIMEDAGFE